LVEAHLGVAAAGAELARKFLCLIDFM